MLVPHVHGDFGFVDIVHVTLVELGGFVGQLTILTTLLTVLHPQQPQSNTSLLHLRVCPLVIRHCGQILLHCCLDPAPGNLPILRSATQPL